MKNSLFLIIFTIIIFGCGKNETEIIFPEKYFPAYPESWWIYSNGTTVKVDPGYHLHQYNSDLSSSPTTEVWVPRINEQYVYKYKITQNNNRIPLRELLRERVNETWVVDNWQGEEIKRKVEKVDATIILNKKIIKTGDSIFKEVILVIEFFPDNETVWISREAYAPDVGLIRRELNLSDTSVVPFIEKELIDFLINK